MQYRMDKHGTKVSALGFGCMRLPKNDTALCTKLIGEAIKAGINYFDTAYLYSGNEELMGKLLKPYDRSSYYLATKLPPAYCRSGKDFERIFSVELERLCTDYVDYYLMHSMFDIEAWQRLCGYGVREWIAEKKKSGAIRNIGFSYHGAFPGFKALIDSYNWDFCQIQFNYLDEHNQAGLEGLEYAREKGVPVMIMEPLRGGKLTDKLPDKAKKLIASKGQSAAKLGLDWVWDHEGILTVLSGMNELSQLYANTEACETALPGSMPKEERETVEEIKKIFSDYSVIPCTGCGYCLPCPHGVAIPSCFSARNAFEFSKGSRKPLHLNPARGAYIQGTGYLGKAGGYASLCVGCGACEKKCPQHIAIRSFLAETAKVMEPKWLTLPLTAARKINSRK